MFLRSSALVVAPPIRLPLGLVLQIGFLLRGVRPSAYDPTLIANGTVVKMPMGQLRRPPRDGERRLA